MPRADVHNVSLIQVLMALSPYKLQLLSFSFTKVVSYMIITHHYKKFKFNAK